MHYVCGELIAYGDVLPHRKPAIVAVYKRCSPS